MRHRYIPDREDRPEILAEISTGRALLMHRASHATSKHAGTGASWRFPYENARQRGDLASGFVRAKIPARHIDASEGSNADRIQRYRGALEKRPALYGPSWGTFGPRSQRKCPERPIVLVDGNHRAWAQIENGAARIEVMLPRAHYEAYERMYRGD